jgi:hypothetical protein
MKKKLIDNVKIIIIILIAVTILFAILGAFNISTKEYMSNSDYQSDDAPQCYPDAVVTEDDDSGYSSYHHDHTDDMYILKTKIVPPKGTACPSKISDPASNYLNGIGASAVAVGGVAESNNSQSESTSFMSITTPETQKKETEKEKKSEPEQKNSNTKNREILNEPKGSVSQTNQKTTDSGSCPPCPACERCPEPAFECKKVPNYRSPSIGQYMPMPILTDFSKF